MLSITKLLDEYKTTQLDKRNGLYFSEWYDKRKRISNNVRTIIMNNVVEWASERLDNSTHCRIDNFDLCLIQDNTVAIVGVYSLWNCYGGPGNKWRNKISVNSTSVKTILPHSFRVTTDAQFNLQLQNDYITFLKTIFYGE